MTTTSRIACLAIAAFDLLASTAPAAESPGKKIWKPVTSEKAKLATTRPWIVPDNYRSFELDLDALEAQLGKINAEPATEFRQPDLTIDLPMPDGSFASFRIIESPVMEPELAAAFPEIKCYRGHALGDPSSTIRLSMSPYGFSSQILSPEGAYYIDRLDRDNLRLHASYSRKDYSENRAAPTDDAQRLPRVGKDGFNCQVLHDHVAEKEQDENEDEPAERSSGTTLRTYRIAVACTAEYTAFHSNPSDSNATKVAKAQAAIVTAINRITGIYETELAVRLVLVANNNLLLYTNASTDPYDDQDPGQMIDVNQATIDGIIGSANYDIGHAFSTGAGGLASLACVCRSNKANGVTGVEAPTGDLFWVDFVAHEIGHQFGANHTFNSSSGSCGGNRNPSTAYEPGSGSTIMAYADLCDSDDLQSFSDPYFHTESYDEIFAHIDTTSCAVSTATGNAVPSVQASADYTIPANTPFELTATGSDADSEDVLTYAWEERDLGPATSLLDADNGSSPLFRTWLPTTSPTRVFPRLSDLLNNTTATGERLPTTSRTMNFRVTVRDNRSGGGGVNQDDAVLTVTNSAGPFRVTTPNSSGLTFINTVNVAWDVANTTAAPISTSNVDILLSTDGGNTYPITLLAGTPNDGSQSVDLPAIATTTARIKIKAADNVYFDISDFNFTIDPPAGPTLNIDDPSLVEGDSGSSQATFTVILSESVGSTVTVDYNTTNGTATAGSDYTAKSGQLEFLSGTLSQTVSIDVAGDLASEADEVFHLDLSAPVNAALGETRGTATIINDDFDPPVITSSSATTGTINVPFSFQLMATDSPTSYEYSGTLPDGIDFSPSTGEFFGTPTEPGIFPLNVSATNAEGTGTGSLEITISANPLNDATDSIGMEFSSGGNVPWYRITGSTPITTDGIDAAASGSIGDSQESWVETEVSGPDTLFFFWRVSSEEDFDFLELRLDGSFVDEISGETEWQQKSIEIPSGNHTIRWTYTKDISFSDGQDTAFIDSVRLISTNPEPILNVPPTITAGQNLVFDFQIEASSDPTSYAAVGLPDGLSVDTTSGRISGIPTTNGTYSLTVSATNENGTASAPLNFIVGPPLDFSTALDTPPGLLTLIGGGDANWVPQNVVTSDGVDAIRSGSILNNHESILQTTVTGPDVIIFDWTVSSEQFYDELSFEIDGQAVRSISGSPTWSKQVVTIDPGVHHLSWRYAKDVSDQSGSDAGYLDQVSLVSESLKVTNFERTGTNDSDTVISFATVTGVLYSIYRSENLIDWTPIHSDIAGTGGIITRTETLGGSEPRRYYQVRVFAP